MRLILPALTLCIILPPLSAQQTPKPKPGPPVGKRAPEIRGVDLDGKRFKLSDYRGKVVVLDFWGNW